MHFGSEFWFPPLHSLLPPSLRLVPGSVGAVPPSLGSVWMSLPSVFWRKTFSCISFSFFPPCSVGACAVLVCLGELSVLPSFPFSLGRAIFFIFSCIVLVFQGGWLFGFLAFVDFTWVSVAFTWVYVGFCGFSFCILCIHSSSLFVFVGSCGFLRLWLFASSAFPVGFWPWLPASSASPVLSGAPRQPPFD